MQLQLGLFIFAVLGGIVYYTNTRRFRFSRAQNACLSASNQKHWTRTIEKCSTAIAIDPENDAIETIMYLRAEAYFYKHELKKVISECERWENIKRWEILRVKAYFRGEEFEKVLIACEDQDVGGEFDLWKAKALNNLGRRKEAIDFLSGMANPSFAVKNFKHQLILEQRQHENRIESQRLSSIAHEAFERRNWSLAIKKWTEALTLHPKNDEIVPKLVQSYLNLQQYDNALSACDKYCSSRHATDRLKVETLVKIGGEERLTQAYSIISQSSAGTTENLWQSVKQQLMGIWDERFKGQMYYHMLGLSVKATAREIQQTHRLNEAYRVLSDPKSKRAYDYYLDELFQQRKRQASRTFKRKFWSETVLKCTKALEIFPHDQSMLTMRIRAYFNAGDYKKALSECDESPDVFEPLKVELLIQIGGEERLTQALDILNRNFHKSFETRRQVDQIETELKEIWQLRYNGKRYYQVLKISHESRNWEIERAFRKLRPSRAVREAYQVLSTSKLKHAYDLSLAEEFKQLQTQALDAFKRGSYFKSIEKCTKALEIFGNNPQILKTRAQSYFKTVQYDKAIAACDTEPRWSGSDLLKVEILVEIGGEDRLTQALRILKSHQHSFQALQLQTTVERALRKIRDAKYKGKRFYQTLQVHYKAKESQIKDSYRRLAKLYHPSRFLAQTEKFKAINEAYQVLSNKSAKKRYDSYLSDELQQLETIASDAFSVQNWSKTVLKCTRVLKIVPSIDSLYYRAVAYLNLDQFDKAVSDCDQGLMYNERRNDFIVVKAKILIKEKKLHEAREMLAEIKDTSRRVAELYNQVEESIHTNERSAVLFK